MNWLNYHHLLYFREIAKEGSISKASEKLLVGQPALSTQLKQLEESLGVELFERRNRSLALTEEGRLALNYAEEIFNRGEEFLQIFQNKRIDSQSRFCLGVQSGLPKSLARRLIEHIKEFAPKCSVIVSESEHEELERRLADHKLDLVLTNESARVCGELLRQEAGSAPVFIYGHKKFYRGGGSAEPQVYSGAPFALPGPDSRLRQDIAERFSALGVEYELAAECQDLGTLIELARSGLAMIFLPEYEGLRHQESEGALKKIGELEGLRESYWLLFAKKVIKNKLTEYVVRNFRVVPERS